MRIRRGETRAKFLFNPALAFILRICLLAGIPALCNRVISAMVNLSPKPAGFLLNTTRYKSRSISQSLWRRALWIFLCLQMFAGHCGSSGEELVSKEYQIKAAYLYNFTKFVEWPGSSFPLTSSPLVIGVFGTNPFGAELEKIVHGRRFNDREIVVKLVENISEVPSLHILFFNSDAPAMSAEILKMIRDHHILTVGESELFNENGGMIKFILEGDKVRFAINLAASERAGIRISAQLLKLANAVIRN